MKRPRVFRALRLDPQLGGEWRHFAGQSAAAAVTLFAIIMLLQFRRAVVGASLGASTFIVFCMPRSISARPRHLLGGHLLGLICGAAFSLVPFSHPVLQSGVLALAVGCTMFLMVATDTEHPPAAGTALGVALAGIDASKFLSFLVSIVLLSAIHRLLRGRMRDLV